ncbi:G-protein coupled receptor 161-like [Dendronephthya gigantea]|uniref:G-protein coupled receptor 161-like n=1 Tax=Dendronephthya gigantea TaxID=151771 RepID=UPI0010694BAC|nr:G-protein coupled receptor 161-like [Dendronephthya gigantea]
MTSLSSYNHTKIDFNSWFTEIATRNATQKSLQALAMSLILILTIVSNGSVVLVLLKSFSIKNVPNMLLFFLTAINLAIGIVNMPFAVISIANDGWLFGSVWCEISGFLCQFLTATSNVMVTVVAIYRYQAIANTFSAQITYRGAKWITAFAWFYSLAFTVPPILGWNSYQYSSAKGFCTLSWQDGGAGMVYTVVFIISCFTLPFVAIVFMYVRIGVITRYNSKTIRTNPTSSSSLSSSKTQGSDVTRHDIREHDVTRHDVRHNDITRRSRSNQRVTKRTLSGSRDSMTESKTIASVSYVVVTYGLFLAPYYVMNIASALSQDALSPEVDFTMALLHFCHATAVAVVYGFNNRRIRTLLKQLPWWPKCPGCVVSRGDRYQARANAVDYTV